MSWWHNLFRRKTEPANRLDEASSISKSSSNDCWEPLPAYIPAMKDEQKLVSIITSAIAAHDKTKSNFKIIKVFKRNPEFLRVSIIAASLASELANNHNYKIRKILKRK